jgi:hypothetical protein
LGGRGAGENRTTVGGSTRTEAADGEEEEEEGDDEADDDDDAEDEEDEDDDKDDDDDEDEDDEDEAAEDEDEEEEDEARSPNIIRSHAASPVPLPISSQSSFVIPFLNMYFVLSSSQNVSNPLYLSPKGIEFLSAIVSTFVRSSAGTGDLIENPVVNEIPSVLAMSIPLSKIYSLY